ncbi:hypothetical protein [Rhizobium leguminosarum]|uniref:hypothetical protein n=1 Tax=Rhizobium leguminosarum TaxID=384 RepID=UPI0013B8003F|nr:hypothetical protein [Rhizobium leguminosarum]MBY5381453.1 hypothetical protein [Rhizobium leguminosarum]MCA2432824.1 hypothetical protein [Rhizobium leguminosarum]NEH68632.1 hypothetical protein [Rhizobium leguminosarum]
MVVIIDRPFLDAMSPMDTVGNVSSYDMVWVVIVYDVLLEQFGETGGESVAFTTL